MATITHCVTLQNGVPNVQEYNTFWVITNGSVYVDPLLHIVNTTNFKYDAVFSSGKLQNYIFIPLFVYVTVYVTKQLTVNRKFTQ